MANNPRKIKDPTEAALSAIQDALNLREPPPAPGRRRDEAPTAEPPAPTDLDFAPRSSRQPAMDEDLFRDQRESQLPLPGVEDPAQRRAANDDRQSVGQILQALQQRPSRTPYVIALALSVAWVIVTLGAAWAFFGADPRALFAQGGVPLFGLAMVVA